jgi:hypothetical protein
MTDDDAKALREAHDAVLADLCARTEERDALRAALEKIAAWQMPTTGRYHPDGTEQSYGWCYGSNGEREVIRSTARAALSGSAAP